MSRPFWHVEIKCTLVNGVSGEVHLQARDLVTLREVKGQLDKALRMCEALKAEPAMEEPAHAWKPSVVA
jgi:hypothetical protein